MDGETYVDMFSPTFPLTECGIVTQRISISPVLTSASGTSHSINGDREADSLSTTATSPTNGVPVNKFYSNDILCTSRTMTLSLMMWPLLSVRMTREVVILLMNCTLTLTMIR